MNAPLSASHSVSRETAAGSLVESIAIFKSTRSRALRLFRFALPGDQLRPGMVFFFGGGWETGTPEQFFPQCRRLAGHGFVAFATEYRTKSTDGTSPFEALADARSCMRWLRANHARIGLQPHRLIAAGGSAGGHLAAACAMLDGFDDPADDVSTSCRPDALVLFNPVLDNGPDGYGFERIRDQFPAFSPAHNVRPGLPPMLILTGTADTIARVETLRAFARKTRALGNPCELREYPAASHGFFNQHEEVNPWFDATLDETLAFCARIGFAPSPPGPTGPQLKRR